MLKEGLRHMYTLENLLNLSPNPNWHLPSRVPRLIKSGLSKSTVPINNVLGCNFVLQNAGEGISSHTNLKKTAGKSASCLFKIAFKDEKNANYVHNVTSMRQRKISESPTGFDPLTFCTLVRCSNH